MHDTIRRKRHEATKTETKKVKEEANADRLATLWSDKERKTEPATKHDLSPFYTIWVKKKINFEKVLGVEEMFGFGKKEKPEVVDMSNDSASELEEVEQEGIVSLARREIGPGELSTMESSQYCSLINSILASHDSRGEILKLVSMSDLSPLMVPRMTALLTIEDYLEKKYDASELLKSFITNICAASIARDRTGRKEIVAILGGKPQSTYQEPPKKKSWWHRLFS